MNAPKGLLNLSSNCYMNSLIQCLYYIKDFRNYFLKMRQDNSKEICSSLKDIFSQLNSNKGKSYCNPEKIINSIYKDKLFSYGEAADVTDLLDLIFYLIKDELKIIESNYNTIIYESRFNNKEAMFLECYNDVDFNIIINQLFVGFYEREFTCKEGHKQYSFSSEYKIIFPIEQIYIRRKKGKNNIIDLDDCFNYYEREQNDNQMEECKICGNQFTLVEKIFRTPKILILILDRGKNKKCKKEVKFDEYIDLQKHIYDKRYNYSTKYRLIGVSTHLGSTGQYGHYISFCLCDNNRYYYFNDSRVEPMTKSICNYNNIYLYDTPYILFYERMDNNEKFKQIEENNLNASQKLNYNKIMTNKQVYYNISSSHKGNNKDNTYNKFKDSISDNKKIIKEKIEKFLFDNYQIRMSLINSNEQNIILKNKEKNITISIFDSDMDYFIIKFFKENVINYNIKITKSLYKNNIQKSETKELKVKKNINYFNENLLSNIIEELKNFLIFNIN